MTDAKPIEPVDPESLSDERLECEVLGGLLLDCAGFEHDGKPYVLHRRITFLREEDFTRLHCRVVYRAILSVLRQHQLDYCQPLGLLARELRERGVYESIGGLPFLTDLCTAYVATPMYAYAAAVAMADLARRRRLALGAQRVAHLLPSDPDSSEQLAEYLRDFRSRSPRSLPTPPGAADVARQYITDLRENRSRVVPVGLAAYDDEYRGLYPGEITVVAARTSQGKTSFALQCATWNTSKDRSVLICSIEEPAPALWTRLASSAAGVGEALIRNRKATAAQYEDVLRKLAEMGQRKLWVDDSCRRITDVYARCDEVERRTGLDLVIVDYVQDFEGDDKRASRTEQIGQMMRELRGIAQDFDIPVMVVAQLNRAAAKEDERPALHHLKDSGAIEQAAAVAILIQNQGDKVNLIVGKHRHGPAGKTLVVGWSPETTMYFSHSQRQEDF